MLWAFFYLLELLNVKQSAILGIEGMSQKLSSPLGVGSAEC